MARISLEPPVTFWYRLGSWVSRRRYGVVLDPAAAIAQNMPVGRTLALFELQVERWHKLDRGLKDLAVMAAAARIGCAWCLDFGYWEATMKHAVPAEKIRGTPDWRDSDVFTDLERLVLEYAEAMTNTPPGVSDELVQQLRSHLTETQLIELTAIIAVENLRSRMNSALGLTSQGFKDRCETAGDRSVPSLGEPATGNPARD